MSDLYDRLQATPGVRVAVPIAGAVLLVVGLAANPWIGIPALVALVAFVAWMAQSSPDHGTRLARLRLLVLGILVALTVGRFLSAVLG